MTAVGEVENPEHGHVPRGRLCVAAERAEQSAPAELGLALGKPVHQNDVVLEDIERARQEAPGALQVLRPDEVEVVRGCMVFGKRTVLAALQQPDGKVESRRAELALVVAVGREVANGGLRPVVGDQVRHRTVDDRISPPALLVHRAAAVADAAQHEAMIDARNLRLVASEPCDGADGSGREQKAVAEPRLQAADPVREVGKKRQAGAVVVGERRVANVCRQQHLAVAAPLVQVLPVSQRAVGQRGLNHHLVDARLQAFELTMGHAEPPVLLVVGGPVGDEIGLHRQGVDPALQVLERQARVDGDAVADDVQGVGSEVDDLSPLGIADVGTTNVPLPRHRPVEDGRAAWNLVDREVDKRRQSAKRFAHAVAGDAAADGIEIGGKCMELLPDPFAPETFGEACHRTGNPGHRYCAFNPGRHVRGRRRSGPRRPFDMSMVMCATRWKRGPSKDSRSRFVAR